MQDLQKMTHPDGREATPGTATDRVQLEAAGFRAPSEKVEGPSADWSHEQLDAEAVSRNVDLAGAKTKAEKVSALNDPNPTMVQS